MNLKQSQETILDYYHRFHRAEYLELDPLLIVHRYKGHPDLELISLMSALFAFGGVKQILKSVENAIQKLNTPSLIRWFQEEKDEKKLAEILFQKLKGFRHRIYVDRDLVMLFLLYRRSYLKHGSLEAHFLKHYSANQETVEEGLAGLIQDWKTEQKEIPFRAGTYFKHMLNSPEQKSTCKRWLMYLKWVIRADDGIDLGLWKSVRADQLVIPLDTHLFKISKRLKLTRRKTANWLAAIEVTRNLKKLDPVDPIKYDFALCRYGMLDYRKKLE